MDIKLEADYVEDVVVIGGLFVVKVCLIEVVCCLFIIHGSCMTSYSCVVAIPECLISGVILYHVQVDALLDAAASFIHKLSVVVGGGRPFVDGR